MADENTPAGGESPDGSQAPAPKFMTVEDFNRATSAREKRFESKLAEMLSKLTTPPVQQDDGIQASGQRADPAIIRLQRQMEETAKKLAESEAKREAAEGRARTEKALTALQGALGAKVAPKMLGRLTKAFRQEMEWDEDSQEYLIPVETKTGTVKLPIVNAIDEWSKTEEAALYLPAPASLGTGSSRTSSQTANAWQKKPQSEWTEADKDAFFQNRLKELSGD